MSGSPAGEIIRVGLGERSYDIHIGAGVAARAPELMAPFLKRKRVVIVTDANVADRHLDATEKNFNAAGIGVDSFILPPGEATKSFKGLEALSGHLLGAKVERGDLIVALGGGVIGDITGLAAGLLRRGVDFAQMPTTLLAQVDSSVGGKTAINAEAGKNLIGLFHQPRIVIADTSLLATLPPREMRAGYAEVVKYGLLGDRAFFEWLETNGARVLAGEDDALVHAVAVSCRAKARIVEADEREAGRRALLNLGHTFGHALEAATGFSDRLLHGEAVALGMTLAFELSRQLMICSGQDAVRAAHHLEAAGLPVRLADIPGGRPTTDELLGHMEQDKKVRDGRPVFVLARGIGDAIVSSDVPPDAVRALLDEAA